MMDISQIRQYANLPDAIDEAMIQAHLDIAAEEVEAEVALDLSDLNAKQAKWLDEAVMNYCLSSLIPHLNTFYGDGASQAHALEGTVDYRWMSPSEVESKVEAYQARFSELIYRLESSQNGLTSFALEEV